MTLKKIIIIENKDHLQQVIKEELEVYGNHVDLNHLDVSNVEDMSFLFSVFYEFNGNISSWNTSNVENMNYMFLDSQFNDDISQWNVSSVKNMDGIFYNSQFNQDLTLWTPTNLKSSLNVFRLSICQLPYWVDCENNKILKEKIKEFTDNLNLKTQLENELIINCITKKLKL
jgi:surface protein